jgi:hypothetical protein
MSGDSIEDSHLLPSDFGMATASVWPWHPQAGRNGRGKRGHGTHKEVGQRCRENTVRHQGLADPNGFAIWPNDETWHDVVV